MADSRIDSRLRCLIVILLLLVTVLGGCSDRQLYEAIQQNRRFECQNQPERPAKECLDETSESYDKYEKEREELLKGRDP